MLQVHDLVKVYQTEELTETALDHVSLTFRSKEFAVISGPSGSGKSTLLNVLGGLDHCDSGTLTIDGQSTEHYKEKDWGFYRNQRVGFVFQSFNLIPHQTVLANVELAMTLSGISKKQCRQRALEVLTQVGMQEHIHKRPKQLSGGQLQRVAIARALMNDPDIILADEPTGALDSRASHQIAELLQRIAQDRLVIMVTHNTVLAQTYATRIIQLQDGAVAADSNPYTPESEEKATPKSGKVRLRFLTALRLSFQNLRAKKLRTLLTVFAGGIGILGITLILSLAMGLGDYLTGFREKTMITYPVLIQEKSLEIKNIFSLRTALIGDRQKRLDRDGQYIYADNSAIYAKQILDGATIQNDLSAFRNYLEDPQSPIHQYVGKKGIVYQYHTNFSIYAYDQEGRLVRSDADVGQLDKIDSALDLIGSATGFVNGLSALMGSSIASVENFSQLIPGENGALVNETIQENYELLAGSWPESYDQVLLVLDRNNGVDTHALYQLGLIPKSRYEQTTQTILSGERMDALYLNPHKVCGHSFYLIPACDTYEVTENGTFRYVGDDLSKLDGLLAGAVPLKISGVIREIPGATQADIDTAVVYTQALTEYLKDYTLRSAVVQAQQANREQNVLTGAAFAKAAGESYSENLIRFGVIRPEYPAAIQIYVDSYPDKQQVVRCIDDFNRTAPQQQRIRYTDYVEMIISSVRSVMDSILPVLVVFVAIALLIACVLIGIVTGISVRERVKEIGILRALGTSRWNVCSIFNAENVIIGFLAGVFGVLGGYLLQGPMNKLLIKLMDTEVLTVRLPWLYAILFVAISVAVTLLGGLLPARRAAKAEPAVIMKTE